VILIISAKESDTSIFAIAGLDFYFETSWVVSTIIPYIGYVFSNDNIINAFLGSNEIRT
jgi:hypothetical protein